MMPATGTRTSETAKCCASLRVNQLFAVLQASSE